jgi:hypothetical protein
MLVRPIGNEARDTGTDRLNEAHIDRLIKAARISNIATRTGLHCTPLVHRQLGTEESDGGVRFSIGVFNREHEIDAAIAAVDAIVQWSKKRKTRDGQVCPEASRNAHVSEWSDGLQATHARSGTE